MRIDFKKIEMHGFMSFDDEVFDYSAWNGMTLVTGKNNDIPGSKNGSGKSTTFASLLYALFGQLQSKIKNENIVNRYGSDKDLRVVLDFSVDSRDYKVIRGSKKGKASYLELYDGEENITKSSIQETQEFLEEEVLHCDITIFLRTILLSSDQNYNFYMMKKADKKDFVEKLFDISVFGDIYTAIHRDILDLDKKVLAHQNKLIVLNKNADDYSKRIEAHEESKRVKLQQLNESISSTQKAYDELKKQDIKTNEEAVQKLNDAVKKIRDAKADAEAKSRDAYVKISSEQSEKRTLLSSKKTKESEISKHADVMSKLCADCKKVFSDYYKIGQFESEIKEIDEKTTAIDSTIAKLTTEKESADQRVKTCNDKMKLADDRMRQLTEQASKASRELGSLESRITSLKSDLTRTTTEKNPYVELLETSKQSISEENAALEKIESRYKYLKFAENVVSQDTLRKFIIADLISLLNNKIKTYLTKLGSKYTVVFDADMDYEFITEGGSCEFQNFSAGERMRIMIATSFAFRDFMSIRNSLNANILVLDEYFDSAIDATCVESILNILKEYSNDYDQNIYVISHRSEVSSDTFQHMIQVEKTNNISKIVYLDEM